jgi:hypothetical protein
MDLLLKILGGLLRIVIGPIVTWLMNQGIITSDESVKLYAELTTYAVALGWSIYAWVKAHKKQIMALTMPAGSTFAQLKDRLETHTVDVTTPADVVPVPVEKEP